MSSTEIQTSTPCTLPANFGAVLPGKLYRSQYPGPENFQSLVDLKLKTVLTLVPESHDGYDQFLADNKIKHLVISLPANKEKVSMDIRDMLSVLYVVLNKKNYPLLIHCNKGKHRTGTTVACLQRLGSYGRASVGGLPRVCPRKSSSI